MIKNKIHKYIILALSVLVIILVVLYVLQAKELKEFKDEFPFSKVHDGMMYTVCEGDLPYQFEDTDEYILIRGTLYSSDKIPAEIDGIPVKYIASFRDVSSNDLVVPDGVSIIRDRAFAYNQNLRKLVLPAAARIIEFGQTEYCYNLMELMVSDADGNYISENNCIIRKDEMSLIAGCQTSVIPDGVKRIGTQAFMGQIFLKDINIPNSVECIEFCAFTDCLSLNEIYIPKSVAKIGMNAFRRCNNLTIYCEAEEKPELWDDNWNMLNYDNERIEVHWGVSRAEYESIISQNS